MTEWHPILSTVEPAPAVWLLVDEHQREYGKVRLVRRGREIGYRAEAGGALVGYFTTLLPAVRAAHLAHISGSGPQGSANGGASGWERGPRASQ